MGRSAFGKNSVVGTGVLDGPQHRKENLFRIDIQTIFDIGGDDVLGVPH